MNSLMRISDCWARVGTGVSVGATGVEVAVSVDVGVIVSVGGSGVKVAVTVEVGVAVCVGGSGMSVAVSVAVGTSVAVSVGSGVSVGLLVGVSGGAVSDVAVTVDTCVVVNDVIPEMGNVLETAMLSVATLLAAEASAKIDVR